MLPFSSVSSSEHNKWDNKWCQDIWILCPIPLFMWSYVSWLSWMLCYEGSIFNSAAWGKGPVPGQAWEKVKPSPALVQHNHHTYRDKPWRRWLQWWWWWWLAWRSCLQDSCDLSSWLYIYQLNSESVLWSICDIHAYINISAIWATSNISLPVFIFNSVFWFDSPSSFLLSAMSGHFCQCFWDLNAFSSKH